MRTVAVIAVAALTLVACFADPDPDPGPALPDPADSDPIALLRAFSGCVQTPDLATAQFAEKWSGLSSNTGACQVCHTTADTGGYEPIQLDDAAATDQVAGTLVRIQVFFAADVDDVVVNLDHFIATSTNVAPHEEHPAYDLEGRGTLDALEAIYSDAHARFTAGACDPPRF